MWVYKRIPSREAVVEIVNYAEEEIEPTIYNFVRRFLPPSLTTTDVEVNKEFSYYLDILKKDDKFMKVVDKVYEEMHKSFEKSYEILKSI